MKNLTIKQKKVAQLIQKDIALRKYPFKIISKSSALNETEVLEITKQLLENGFVRKFGAMLRHQKAGYKENALVIWSVDAEQKEKVGTTFALFPFISHCYERDPSFLNKYNIFTMLHSGGRSISSLVKEMVVSSGIKDYLILKSLKEYKKTSPEYF